MAKLSAANDRRVATPRTDPSPTANRVAGNDPGAALLVFAVVALTNMQTGLHSDPRTTNPDPGLPPYPPSLGATPADGASHPRRTPMMMIASSTQK